MQTTPTYLELEEEIKKAFSELKPDDTSSAILLSKMELKPLEKLLFNNYKTWLGDQRVKYPPMALIKAMLLQELRGMKSCYYLIDYLYRNPKEGKSLGFKDKFLPSPQTFSVMRRERINDNIQQMMDFIVEKIRETAREEGKLLDIDFVLEGDGKKKSKRTIERHKNKEGAKIIRFLRNEIFPTLELPLECKARYCKENFLDLLAYVAYNNVCANQGHQLMKEEDKFQGRVPHARTMLGYLAKLDSEEIKEMFIAAFDRIFKIAKSRGLLNGLVDIAIDFHDWLYYGDKNDKMVVEGEPKLGTTHRFRFVTIKVAERYGDFTLLALPVGVFTNEVEAVRKLIEFAKERVEPRYFYIDRGFYSAKYISLFEEMGIKYLMPGVKNKRIKRLMEKYKPPVAIDIRLRDFERKGVKTKLVVSKDKDGEDVCFITNLPPLLLYGGDLFRFYRKRWNIETGYRVKKHEFRANTTSKNHKIRCFYFMFSTLLYNLWVITNAFLSKYLFGEQVKYRIMTAKMFMKKFYEAYGGYVP